MASQYFIQRDGEETGPFGFKELVVFVRDGKLVHSDQVRFSWTHDWQRADSLVGLFHMAQKSPEDLSRHDVPPVAPVADEPIPVQLDEQVAIPEIQDRPGWVLRLMNIGGFRKTRPAENTLPGPAPGMPPETTAAFQSTDEAAPSPASRAGGDGLASSRATSGPANEELPAEMAAYFKDTSGQSNRWSSAVEDALAAVTARGAGRSARSRSGRLQKMFGGLARFIPLSAMPTGEQRQSLMRNGFRIFCAIVCSNLVVWAVDSWSAQEALRFPSRDAQIASLHHFPVVGTCGPGEYLFLMFDLMLVAGAAAWFAAGWLETRAE